MAAHQDLKYIWIDTCCIDKASSAELSEAINSMFRYYKEAVVCYTYLSDVTATTITHPVTHSKESSERSDFYDSTWFTRGWTLQEMIAPQNLRFYNKEWDFLGTKAELGDAITRITKVPKAILLGRDLTNEPVSRRMSWVASRETTVPEDIAYCLLGLFQVNIPLLHGEGQENAFLRLQEAILKISDDDSIFLWRATEDEAIKEPFWGLLAKSPMYFLRSPGITAPCTTSVATNTPATLTGRGLNVEFLMALVQIDISNSIFSATILVDRGRRAYGVLLQRLSYSGAHFARVGADILLENIGSQEIDYSKLPRRLSNSWNPQSVSSVPLISGTRRDAPLDRPLAEPQALRFYVRQNSKIPPVTLAEAIGFSFEEVKSLPPDMSVVDWSSNWDRRESVGFTHSEWVYVLHFETKHLSKRPTYQNGTVWIAEPFGTLEISEKLHGSSRELILLVALETTPFNTLNTPLTCHRPSYLLYDCSQTNAHPDGFLRNFSPSKMHARDITSDSSYAVSFDLQLLYGQPYYLVRIEKRAERKLDIAVALADREPRFD